MRLVWCTDIHLNFLGQPFGPKAFGKYVREQYPDLDAVVVTGDLAECDSFKPMIEAFADGVGAPVWFVLGNHDAYGGSIQRMRQRAQQMTKSARWLVSEKLVELAPGVCLVGQDGWYDARNGDYRRSNVVLNDFLYIKELRVHGANRIVHMVREVADQESAAAKVTLREAVQKGYRTIVFATHVPPFALAAWHEGKISDGNWLPWMSSRTMGDALDEVSCENPDVEFIVLCGHTHGDGTYRRSPNLTVYTGKSAYGNPCVTTDFTFLAAPKEAEDLPEG